MIRNPVHNPIRGGSVRRRRSVTGLSMIELLVALALSGVVLTAAGALLMQSYSNEMVYRQQNVAQAEARAAVTVLTDDLRGAKKGSLALGALTSTSPLYFNLYDDSSNEMKASYWLVAAAVTSDGYNLWRKVERVVPPSGYTTPAGVAVARFIPTTSDFTVIRASNTVTVTATVSRGTAPNNSSVTVSANVVLRNDL